MSGGLLATTAALRLAAGLFTEPKNDSAQNSILSPVRMLNLVIFSKFYTGN